MDYHAHYRGCGSELWSSYLQGKHFKHWASPTPQVLSSSNRKLTTGVSTTIPEMGIFNRIQNLALFTWSKIGKTKYFSRKENSMRIGKPKQSYISCKIYFTIKLTMSLQSFQELSGGKIMLIAVQYSVFIQCQWVNCDLCMVPHSVWVYYFI